MWPRRIWKYASSLVVMTVSALALIAPDAAHAAVCGVPNPYPTIQIAISDTSCVVIQLAATTFNENVTVNRDVYINGSNGTIVNGGGIGPVFTINTNVNVTLANMTVTNGKGTVDGGGIFNKFGNLTANNLTIIGNSAPNGSGGGIFDRGNVTLNSSTVMSNSAVLGGGIYDYPLEGNLIMNGSTVSGNSATDQGGGIWNGGGGLAMARSTISGNAANNSAGGIYNNSPVATSLAESTVAFNLADAAGKNSSAVGGGVEVITPTVFNVSNSILASNFVLGCSTLFCIPIPNDCSGTLTSQDYNLVGIVSSDCTLSGSTGHNITNQSALLGPLANNGGPTQTHALLKGSPAVDAIFNGQSGCGTNPLIDQRGWARPARGIGNCDIGAYERGVFVSLPLIVR